MTSLDPRLHAYRPDVADARLEGRVESAHFVEGRRLQVRDPILSVLKAPRPDAMQLSQALLGETVLCFDEQEGWAFVQLETDGYVGYVSANGLTAEISQATHQVDVPSTLCYPAPNLKSQPVTFITLNAAVTVVANDGKFARLHDGQYVWAQHLREVGRRSASDFVALAEKFLHVPYYWGGKSIRGLDCSGLVQICLEASGTPALRDSDMQQQTLGMSLPADLSADLRRGDLIFWNGHVGIMTDESTLLHANGHHMLVVAEPLEDAVKRIAASYGHITGIKRLQ